MTNRISDGQKPNILDAQFSLQTGLTTEMNNLFAFVSDCFKEAEQPAKKEGVEPSLEGRADFFLDEGCVGKVVMTLFGPLIDLIPNCFQAKKAGE